MKGLSSSAGIDFDQPIPPTGELNGPKWMTEKMRQGIEWQSNFPRVAEITGEVSATLDARFCGRNYRAGETIFGPKRPLRRLLFPVLGTLRLQRTEPWSGKAERLGYVHGGEDGVFTTICAACLSGNSVEALAETDVEGVELPVHVFDYLFANSIAFRTFVLRACSERLSDLYLGIESMTAWSIDTRLADKLTERTLRCKGSLHPALRSNRTGL